MGFSALIRNVCFLFILVSASLLPTSFAGGARNLMDKHAVVGEMTKETPKKCFHSKEAIEHHPRILKVKTNDYARYDPAPALVKPPFKLIPN